MATIEKLYTPEEVAEYLGFNIAVIRRKILAGEIKGIKIGNRWRVKESELERLVNDNHS